MADFSVCREPGLFCNEANSGDLPASAADLWRSGTSLGKGKIGAAMIRDKERAGNELEQRLKNAESALRAIRSGSIDPVCAEKDEALLLHLEHSEKKEAHVKKNLLAVRNVHKLILKENDPQKLIELACANLTETLGYHRAWIAIMDGDCVRALSTAHSGFDGGFDKIREKLESGDLTRCIKMVLGRTGIVVIENPRDECSDCPASADYTGKASFCKRLECKGKVFGLLSVSVPSEFAGAPEEQALFDEICDDLAFALKKIETDGNLREMTRIVNQSRSVAFIWKNVHGWPIVFVSDNVSIFGFSPRDFQSEKISAASLIHPEDLPRIAAELRNCGSNPRVSDLVQEYRIVSPLGKIYHVEDRTWIRRDEKGSATHFEGILSDVTDSKKREERVAVLNRMLDEAAVSITIHDRSGKFLFANKTALHMHGYESFEDFSKVNLTELDTPEYAKLIPIRNLNITKYGETAFEASHFRKDGSPFPLHVIAKKIIWEGQEAVLGISLDISKLKEVELALSKSEEKFSKAFYISPLAVTITRLSDGLLIDVNDAFCEISGYSREEAMSASSIALNLWSDPKDRDFVLKELEEKGAVTGKEFIFRRKDGKTITGLFSSHVLELNGRKCALSCINDISQRKAAEKDREELHAQLMHAQKMEAVGQLAGGIAHDFNNALQVINGYSQLLLKSLGDNHEQKESVEHIFRAGKHAANLTRQLLAFGRRQILRLDYSDLNQIIGEFIKMLRRVIGENIKIDFMPGHNPPTIHVDRSQIEQIVMNLCLNAKDAMPSGGVLSIETASSFLDDDYVQTNKWATKGNYAQLLISDTGTGMAPEILSKIFEPFFTTKPVGQGTGLGLSMAYGIVRQHNGYINVESEPGKGAVFTIYIPAVESKTAEAQTKPKEAVKCGTETILVAEDDASVLQFLTFLLEDKGYKVIPAKDGRSAVEKFKEHGKKISLAILDVVMPDMNGKKVMDEIQQLPSSSAMKFLFSSGYTHNVVHKDFVLDNKIQLVSKPYDMVELLSKVREILDSDGKGA